VIIFINKLDREGRDPFDLMDEIEEKLNIKVRPLSWPIGIGRTFQGVYNLHKKSLNLFEASKTKLATEVITIEDLNNSILEEQIGEEAATSLREDVELLDGVYNVFDEETYLSGEVAPVFFGSAFNNFGVKELLDTFLSISPFPRSRNTDQRMVEPTEEKFSGFVFKIHANIDPRHRDRIAFLRICSGKFERNKFFHHVRLNKGIRFSNPTSFMAQDKSVVEEAFPGDVVGLYDSGNFKIGDTLTEGENLMFKGIPSFSPEIFKELVNKDPMKSKQLEKGIRQLTDEGVAQLFIKDPGNRKIVGTVGELQFEVIQYRLEHEYGASCFFQPLNYHKALWMTSDNKAQLEMFCDKKSPYIVIDKDQNLVFLAESAWLLRLAIQDYPEIVFHTTSEFKTAVEV
jgi:peptide chain release factor 3